MYKPYIPFLHKNQAKTHILSYKSRKKQKYLQMCNFCSTFAGEFL